MSAPVPVSTWHELRALVAEGGCAAAALPASVAVSYTHLRAHET